MLTPGDNRHHDGFANTLTEEEDAFAIDLPPFGSKFVLVSPEPLAAQKEVPAFECIRTLRLGPCTISTSDFQGRGECWSEPLALEEPRYVTDLPGHESFAGLVRYRFSAMLAPEDCAVRAMLELAGVTESARVTVNGRDCGCRIVPDWRFDVTDALVPGKNAIEIELTSTLGRAMDDFMGQYLPLEPVGLAGAVLQIGA